MKILVSAFADEAANDLEGQISALKRNNIKMIEIRNIDGKCIIDLEEDELLQVKSVLDKNGITVSAIGSPIGKYPINDPFEPHIEAFKRTINAAKVLGTTRIRMFSFFIPKGEEAKKYANEVVHRVAILAKMAVEAGVFCYHENEREIFGDTKERVLFLHNAVGASLKGIFDPSNYILNGENPIDIIDELLPFTHYLHIKDASFSDECVVPAGCGDGEIAKLIEKMSANVGVLLLTVEPHLTVFDGLNSLQNGEIKHRFSYNSPGEAFDAAVGGLKKILIDGGNSYE